MTMRIGGDRGACLAMLFLLAGVAAPTACVFWFMNEAARSQAESAKRSVTEAYRGQLRLLRDRMDSYWDARALALQQSSGARAPADFRRVIMQGGVDSVIFLNADASVADATPTAPFAPNTPLTPEQKAQEQIRSLVQSGKNDVAIEAIEKNFSGNSPLAADERLLLLRLTKSREVMRRLIAQIDDYSAPMSSPHR